jgi:hypothetical protein
VGHRANDDELDRGVATRDSRSGALWQVRPRALLVALGSLLVLDFILRLSLPLPLPWDFRLPNRTTMGYDQLVAKMRRDPYPRVAILGDSIIWGGFAERSETLSAHLQKSYRSEDRKVDVYNLGMNGAHANDMLPVIADLVEGQAADAIVVNFDMRFYTEPTIVRRYPELYDKAPSTLSSVAPDLLEQGAQPASTVPLEKKLGEGAGRVWRLYALRDYLAAALFGDNPASALNHRMNRLRADLFGPPLYGKKSPSGLPLGEIKKAFDAPPMTADNVNIRYLTAALDIARRQGVPVVVFAGPVDSELLDSQHLWDRSAYEANLERVRKIVESHGAEFYAYTDAVPREFIGDSHHPLGPGYEILARAMMFDLDPLLKAAGQKGGTEATRSPSEGR